MEPKATPSGAPTIERPKVGQHEPDDEKMMFYLSIALAAVGLVLFVLAGLVKIAELLKGTTVLAHIEWVLGAGAGLLVLGIGFQFHRVWELLRHRRALVATNVLVMTLLAAGLTFFVNLESYRHFREWDWTQQGLYTLSDDSIAVVQGLKSKVKITVVWTEREGEKFELIKRLLDHYKSKSSNVELEYVDPTRPESVPRLLELELAGKQYEEVSGLIVQAGSNVSEISNVTSKSETKFKATKTRNVGRTELFEPSMDPQNPMRGKRSPDKFKGEQAVTSALMEVSESKKPKIYVLSGHGEPEQEMDMESMGQMGYATKLLRARSYEVATLDLLKKREVPEDASVLLLLSPIKARYSEGEVLAIEKYLKNGGKMFLMAAPFLTKNPIDNDFVFNNTGLEPLLKKYNIELKNQLVLQMVLTDKGVRWQPGTEAGDVDHQHKITQPLVTRIYFLQPRPLVALKDNPRVTTTEIIRATDIGVTKSQKDAVEETERVTLAIAAEEKLDAGGPLPEDGKEPKDKKSTKIVVVGDGLWASNRIMSEAGMSNGALLANSMAWLLDQERFTKEPVREGDYKLDMTGEVATVYSLLALFGLPFLAALAGATVWLVRRR